MTKKKRKWRWRTRYHLMRAGWRPGRNVWGELRLPPSFSETAVAKECLAEFGGLKFGTTNSYMHVEPFFGEEVAGLIRKFEEQIALAFYPLGIQQHQDREYMIIDANGRVFIMNTLDHMSQAELNPLGSSFENVLEYFVIGASCQKEIIADLKSAGLHDKSWRIV